MIKLTTVRNRLERIRTLDRAGIIAFIVGAFFVILNLVVQEPFLGVYGSLFMLMGALFLIVRKMKGPNLMFGPDERLRAYSIVVGIIKESKSYLKVIDLHPAEDTLHALDCSPEGIPVQYLTLTINMSRTERNNFKASAKRLIMDKPNIEIRIADKSAFHDRWILTEPHGWHITQSIKDIGNKIGHFIEMSIDETIECVGVFDMYWSSSQLLLE